MDLCCACLAKTEARIKKLREEICDDGYISEDARQILMRLLNLNSEYRFSAEVLIYHPWVQSTNEDLH